SRAVPGLDLAAGALLRMARLAAAARSYQYLALGSRSHRWTAAARAQLYGHEHRHGAHHAALPWAAALRVHARHPSRLPAGCGQSWGYTGASLLAGLRAVVATRPRRRHRHRLCVVPGFLCHAGSARRWAGDDVVHADRA